MQYIKVEFARAGVVFQEVERGQVLRYLDLLGIEKFVVPPANDHCSVIDAAPTRELWMNGTSTPLTSVVLSAALKEASADQLQTELTRRG